MIQQQYSSKDSTRLQRQFSQIKSHGVCQNRGLYDRLSKGKPYRVKCRNPRCSIDCYENWSKKEATILSRYLSDLDPIYTTFRGNFKLRKDAGEKAHRNFRSKFMRALKRREKKHGVVIKILCMSHITDPRNMHYDFVGYGSLPHAQLKGIIRDCWKIAGGTRFSCPLLEEPAVKGQSFYIFKVNDRRYKHLPKQGGLPLTFGSNIFFAGTSKKAIWQDFLKQVEASAKLSHSIISKTLTSNPTSPLSDLELLTAKIPLDYDNAIDVNTIAASLYWSEDRVKALLPMVQDIVYVDKWVQWLNKSTNWFYTYRNRWYRNPPAMLDFDTELAAICASLDGITAKPEKPRDPDVWPILGGSRGS